MRRARRIALAATATAAVLSPAAVVANTTASQAEGVDATLHLNVHHVHYQSGSPPSTVGAPACDPAGHCMFPYSVNFDPVKSVSTGDVAGTWVGSGGATVIGTALYSSALATFNGTVTGCGTGSFLLRLDSKSFLDGSPGTTTWTIEKGSGTGDLVNITGFGTGDTSAAVPTSDGFVFC
jgi:hypothetical protein